VTQKKDRVSPAHEYETTATNPQELSLNSPLLLAAMTGMTTFVEMEPGKYLVALESVALLELHLVHVGGETFAEWRTHDGEALVVFTPATA